ncbi:MAG: dephospho-CoA kinase [Actinomycetota bacterium]
MITIGLTGGIGSGKSTVSAALVERGASLVDADAIVRELQQPGEPVFDRIVERFGAEVVGDDGLLDRPAIAGIVFGDADALADLNRIVHPAVGEEIRRRLAELAATDRIVVLDIPLLAEGAKDGTPRYPVSGTLVVDVPVEVQVARLVEHRGFDEADARARIANQASREDRLALADRVIDNGGLVDALAPQIDDVWAWATGLDPVDLPLPDPTSDPQEQP